jgi:hypothetical protein
MRADAGIVWSSRLFDDFHQHAGHQMVTDAAHWEIGSPRESVVSLTAAPLEQGGLFHATIGLTTRLQNL